MIKWIIAILLLSSAQVQAQYKLQFNIANNESTKAYLGFYYGRNGQVLKKDSAEWNAQEQSFTFLKKDSIVGGIYLIVFADHSGNFEFILDNKTDFTARFDKKNPIATAEFKNSPENTKFYTYQKISESLSPLYAEQEEILKKSVTFTDSNLVFQRFKSLNDSLSAFRADYSKKNPSLLSSKIFNCMSDTKVPSNLTGRDSFLYKKNHYWDEFVFDDNRIINTPIWDGKLTEYFKYVVPVTDSFNREADWLLNQFPNSKEMYKYTLWWLTRYAESSKVMGMDESFLYLVENYYMKGKAFWLKEDLLERYIKRAREISPTALGNPAAELTVPNIDGKLISFKNVFEENDYTIIVFWSSDCHHCIKDVPVIDSIVRTFPKTLALKLIGFHTEKDENKWQPFIQEKKLDPYYWHHVHDLEGISQYYARFDIRATPDLYIVDRSGKIVGKHVSPKSLKSLIESLIAKRK
jgi:thiol-disulfide isomerase/thioredoxin